MKVYKVEHIPTGLFWKGGGVPNYMSYNLTIEKVLEIKFSKKGKTWNQLNHVKSALTYQKGERIISDLLKECEIITYTLIIE